MQSNRWAYDENFRQTKDKMPMELRKKKQQRPKMMTISECSQGNFIALQTVSLKLIALNCNESKNPLSEWFESHESGAWLRESDRAVSLTLNN